MALAAVIVAGSGLLAPRAGAATAEEAGASAGVTAGSEPPATGTDRAVRVGAAQSVPVAGKGQASLTWSAGSDPLGGQLPVLGGTTTETTTQPTPAATPPATTTAAGSTTTKPVSARGKSSPIPAAAAAPAMNWQPAPAPSAEGDSGATLGAQPAAAPNPAPAQAPPGPPAAPAGGSGPTGFAAEVANAVRQLPGGGNGAVFHPYELAGHHSWGATNLNSCEVWVSPSTPANLILDVVRHEYMHVLQCRIYGGDINAMEKDAGGWNELDRIADAGALQLGAGWVNYTYNPTAHERQEAANLLAGRRMD